MPGEDYESNVFFNLITSGFKTGSTNSDYVDFDESNGENDTNSSAQIFNNSIEGLCNFTSVIYSTQNIFRLNETNIGENSPRRSHPFERLDVRVIFISMYALVFSCCFFGEYCIKNFF